MVCILTFFPEKAFWELQALLRLPLPLKRNQLQECVDAGEKDWSTASSIMPYSYFISIAIILAGLPGRSDGECLAADLQTARSASRVKLMSVS